MNQMDGMDAGDVFSATAGDNMRSVQETIKRTASKAGEYVRTQAEETRKTPGRKLADTAGDLHSMNDETTEQDSSLTGGLMHKAADAMERAADYINATSVDQMWSGLEDFSRRRPWVVVSAGLIVGIVLARAAKSFMSNGNGRRFNTADFREF